MKINKFTSIVASLMFAGTFTSVSACEAPVDVHPLSCPNPISATPNKKGDITGLTPAAILGGAVDGFGVEIKMNDINTSKPVVLFITDHIVPGDTTAEDTYLSNGYGAPGNPQWGAEAVKVVIDDVAAPAPEGWVNPALCGLDENNCYGQEDGNGKDKIADLVLKFKTQDVVDAIEGYEADKGREVLDGDTYCVTILARENNTNRAIHGTDTVRINKK